SLAENSATRCAHAVVVDIGIGDHHLRIARRREDPNAGSGATLELIDKALLDVHRGRGKDIDADRARTWRSLDVETAKNNIDTCAVHHDTVSGAGKHAADKWTAVDRQVLADA